MLKPDADVKNPEVAHELDDAAIADIGAGCLDSDCVQTVPEPAERVDGGWWVPVRVFISDESMEDDEDEDDDDDEEGEEEVTNK